LSCGVCFACFASSTATSATRTNWSQQFETCQAYLGHVGVDCTAAGLSTSLEGLSRWSACRPSAYDREDQARRLGAPDGVEGPTQRGDARVGFLAHVSRLLARERRLLARQADLQPVAVALLAREHELLVVPLPINVTLLDVARARKLKLLDDGPEVVLPLTLWLDTHQALCHPQYSPPGQPWPASWLLPHLPPRERRERHRPRG
jgi:hypothetical protein